MLFRMILLSIKKILILVVIFFILSSVKKIEILVKKFSEEIYHFAWTIIAILNFSILVITIPSLSGKSSPLVMTLSGKLSPQSIHSGAKIQPPNIDIDVLTLVNTREINRLTSHPNNSAVNWLSGTGWWRQKRSRGLWRENNP